MPTPLEIIDRYDLTSHDLHPEAGEPEYEPSDHAIEVARAMFGVMIQWNDLADVLDRWTPERLRNFKNDLRKAFDDWDNDL